VSKENGELAADIRAIKMLMVLQLLRSGVRQSQIAAMLGVSEATMSRMLPKGITKGVAKGAAAVAGEDAL
jgi:DNA-binding transcriptional regulator LsrR (DeoR family)